MKPVVLIIRDGWGISSSKKFNAIKLAKTPHHDYWEKEFPTAILKASGLDVGLPKGYQGNSEVGHLNLGSGRVVFQMLTIINKAIKNRTFNTNKKFLKAINNCKKHNSTLHIMGLVQDQGVHAHQDHCIALLKLANKHNVKTFVHIFSDGRDTEPKSTLRYINKVKQHLSKAKFGVLVGRYYAMDRDNRWKRTKLAYDAINDGIGKPATSITAAVKDAYKNKETDEFIKPRILNNYTGIQNNDSIIFFNYRLDRARQITKAFTADRFNHFKRNKKKIIYIPFTKYYDGVKDFAFEERKMKNLLSEVISKKGLKQLHTAETEKYAHVTYFFNGEREKPVKGESRTLINSPKIATYDLKPEMSAYKITDKLIKSINSRKYDLIVVNYANGDMVGHTGKMKVAIKAVQTVDECCGKVVDATLRSNGCVILAADHGNCEDMSPKHQTAHTTNVVPITIIGAPIKKLNNGRLADVAPTILSLMKIKQPKEMTGKSLIRFM